MLKRLKLWNQLRKNVNYVSDTGFKGYYNQRSQFRKPFQANISFTRNYWSSAYQNYHAVTLESRVESMADQILEEQHKQAVEFKKNRCYVYWSQLEVWSFEHSCQEARHSGCIDCSGCENVRWNFPSEVWYQSKTLCQCYFGRRGSTTQIWRTKLIERRWLSSHEFNVHRHSLVVLINTPWESQIFEFFSEENRPWIGKSIVTSRHLRKFWSTPFLCRLTPYGK